MSDKILNEQDASNFFDELKKLCDKFKKNEDNGK